MNLFFLVLYGLTALINILSIQGNRYIIRFVSKICLVPILILLYISKSDSLSFIFILALFFSWCGDLLLINPGKWRLYAGILSFLVSHILYILVISKLAHNINVAALIFSFLFILSIEYLLVKKSQIPNNHLFPIIVYGIAIGLLVVFSLQVFIYYKNTGSILLVIGSVSFFISDAVLSYFTLLKKTTRNSRIVVMLSYIIAQACIVIGYMNI